MKKSSYFLINIVTPIFLLAILFVFSACGTQTAKNSNPEDTPLPSSSSLTYSATPAVSLPEESEMVMDATCNAAIRGMAWIDENANGIQDKDEPPLPGVRFRKAGEDTWSEVSDKNGFVTVEFMFGGDPISRNQFINDPSLSCDLATERVLTTNFLNGHPLEIEPEIPSGYHLTTSVEDNTFGFTLLDQTTIPAPIISSTNAAVNNLLISEKPRLEPSVPPVDLEALVDGNNTFAFDLYKQLKQDDDNLFFSPYSISQALAMVYGGARGEIARQMADVLHFTLPQERLHPALNSLALSLEERSQVESGQPTPEATPEPAFELNVANAVWGQKGLPFLSTYLDLLAQNYGAGLKVVDFKGSPERVVKEINDWVKEQTRGRIQKIIGELGHNTGLLLANAIYFNARWDLPFDETPH
jgi:hypothetical protein